VCPASLLVIVDFSRLSQAAIADIHGVTPRTVRRWTARGCPRNDDGTYSAADTVAWRIRQDHDARGHVLRYLAAGGEP
jgi:phage terminase Nu1 subunit (DNA packaging protein)